MIMLLNESARPTIIIHVDETLSDKNILNQIGYGIEEEGIPYEVINVKDSNHVAIAYEACQKSRLGVGIGITRSYVVLHYEKLNPEAPLFDVSTHEDLQKLRAIGTNGARLVKRMPFKNLHE